ncbi:MAG: hypothetical protein APG12_01328 [Candidatus Methanofastidiosum methylothiophilum]|uniref:Uncharacterized protein n=1 Tax=Candidatus Methanofastidiosum methylothiophilum TaxID=1705564 RepID=A0A150IU66_9EURY|nr:MAG: hypothetical protein APG11_00299 [Candidatus Methanofastidiosum methylthiophilus]KYC49681.1 MAG: hypothetical protein APG12_01328 [Candidatus Methanofastidiosum methylthiophilus]
MKIIEESELLEKIYNEIFLIKEELDEIDAKNAIDDVKFVLDIVKRTLES